MKVKTTTYVDANNTVVTVCEAQKVTKTMRRWGHGKESVWSMTRKSVDLRDGGYAKA